jgi:hypothetical protein
MTPIKGMDLAWARPTVSQITGAGAHWVARYFSKDDSKDLHPTDVPIYRAAGLSIITVWETTAGRATAGNAAGVLDAKDADRQRAAVKLPANHPLYFAVDKDVTWAAVLPYFQGVISEIGLARVGVYGSFKVVEGAHAAGIHYLWQTKAWSNGQWSSHANIRQTGASLLNGTADEDYAYTSDYGQYPKPVVTPAVHPTVHLSHVVAAAKKDPHAAQGHTSYKTEVLLVEHALVSEGLLASKWVDGSFGTKTIQAYQGVQHKLHYTGNAADGIPGFVSLTWLGHRHGFTAVR